MKLLYVHERFGALAGAEANAHITATELGRLGHTVGILHGPSTGKNETAWHTTFPARFALGGGDNSAVVRQALAEFQPEAVYVHKMAALSVIQALVESGRPLLRMVHDHDIYCLRSYKYNYFTRRICTRAATPYCVFPCLASLVKNSDAGFPLKWVSYTEKKREIALNRQFDRMVVVTEYMKVRLVAIVGGSGSGKTRLTRQLKRRLGRLAGIITVDDFYRDLSHLPETRRARTNFDHPDAIEWELFHDCLARIRAGEAVRLPHYDFKTHTRQGWRTWRPRPMVLVDGLWLLHREELRELYTLSVFVDCPEEVRLQRRLERDQFERKRTRASILRQFRQQVAPMHNQFVEPQKQRAEFILDSTGRQAGLSELHNRLARIASGTPA